VRQSRSRDRHSCGGPPGRSRSPRASPARHRPSPAGRNGQSASPSRYRHRRLNRCTSARP